MKHIQLKDAEATLGAVIDDAQRGQPSIITRQGKPEAVVISLEDWKRLSDKPSFAEFLASAPFEEGDIPERDQTPLRLPDWAR